MSFLMTNKSLLGQNALYFTPEFSMNCVPSDCISCFAYEKLMNIDAAGEKSKINATEVVGRNHRHALKLKYVHRQSDLGLHGSCM